MILTTPAPGYDVPALFPGIERCSATATRLHPRRGTPDRRASHLGGPLWWPADEPWPACAAEHLVPVELAVPAAVRARLDRADPARGWSGYEAAIAELASEIPGFGGVDHRTGSALGYSARREPAPGWKVGGWPAWPTTDPRPMCCVHCGAPMRQLLQIDSGEWGDPQRWRPREEDRLRPGTAEHTAASEPTGVVAGRSGLYRIFGCPCSPDAPVLVDPQ